MKAINSLAALILKGKEKPFPSMLVRGLEGIAVCAVQNQPSGKCMSAVVMETNLSWFSFILKTF